MRISDWSSDVCSSDLRHLAACTARWSACSESIVFGAASTMRVPRADVSLDPAEGVGRAKAVGPSRRFPPRCTFASTVRGGTALLRRAATFCRFAVGRHWTCFRVCRCRRCAVAFDVLDEPLHFEDLASLRFADFDSEFTHQYVLDLGAFRSRDGE